LTSRVVQAIIGSLDFRREQRCGNVPRDDPDAGVRRMLCALGYVE